ncbi:MAG TPA: hypothetical protein H9876_05125 [Candidatus Limosilactobacillus merdipullorum]|uniref:Uncharacterized protein n=1 Tax=Candidatus Limosilactobacillus merdipullorum TaxID=2838653 RepID=A0A9D1QRL3_9LACO|nr:hypothetical protein [Candidatus Limosilactobacillus merdipullorum]
MYNTTYYKPSMTLYCLVIITLVAALFFYDQRTRNFGRLSVMHFIATYAHRACLSNIFWEQLLWHGLRLQQYAAAHSLWVLLATWGVHLGSFAELCLASSSRLAVFEEVALPVARLSFSI